MYEVSKSCFVCRDLCIFHRSRLESELLCEVKMFGGRGRIRMDHDHPGKPRPLIFFLRGTDEVEHSS
jgi:hypothetical protein